MNRGIINEIHGIFNPRSVAVVGVSDRTNRLGNILLYSLMDMGFSGPLYPVNPNESRVMGLVSSPRVQDIAGPVDLAIISVHPRRVASVVEDCVAKGVKAAVIFSSGFRELGEQGRQDEQRIVETARNGGMRIIGPNCMGLYSPDSGLSFFPGMPREQGRAAFLSQSGSLANMLGVLSVERGIRYSKMISVGNAADLDVNDFLEYLGQDDDTGIIALYLEGVSDGRRFLELSREISRRKPVLLWKVGETEGGSRAAGSHTGSMSGSESVWRGVMSQAGLIKVENLNELLGYLSALENPRLPAGNRVVIMSGPGGPAVSTADACEKQGLKLAELSTESKDRLAEFVPDFGASTSNPVDLSLTSSFDMNMYPRAAEICGSDDNVDMQIAYIPVLRSEMLEGLIKAQQRVKKHLAVITSPEFSVLDSPVSTMFGSLSRDEMPHLLKRMYEAGISVHATEQETAKVLHGLLRYRLYRDATGRQ